MISKARPKTWPRSGRTTVRPSCGGRDLGDGYSSIVYDGQRLYTMYWLADTPAPADGGDAKDEAAQAAKKKGQEVVIALDPATGKTVWEHKYPAPWGEKMDITFGPGPNSTPLIVGDRIFTIGATVKLHCLDRATGKVTWAHDLVEEYKADTMMYGYGGQPHRLQGHHHPSRGRRGTRRHLLQTG